LTVEQSPSLLSSFDAVVQFVKVRASRVVTDSPGLALS
jgi:hypothetical protein